MKQQSSELVVAHTRLSWVSFFFSPLLHLFLLFGPDATNGPVDDISVLHIYRSVFLENKTETDVGSKFKFRSGYDVASFMLQLLNFSVILYFTPPFSFFLHMLVIFNSLVDFLVCLWNNTV